MNVVSLRKVIPNLLSVYSEAATMEAADEIGQKITDVVYSLAK